MYGFSKFTDVELHAFNCKAKCSLLQDCFIADILNANDKHYATLYKQLRLRKNWWLIWAYYQSILHYGVRLADKISWNCVN